MRIIYFNNMSVFSGHACQESFLLLGLSTNDVRRIAFDNATKLTITAPNSWTVNEKAGANWLTLFLKRRSGTNVKEYKKVMHNRGGKQEGQTQP